MHRYRLLQPEDIDTIMPLAKEHFESVGMFDRGFTYNHTDAKEYMTDVSESDDYIPMVHIADNGTIDGIICFQINVSPYCHDDICASEHMWYVSKNVPDMYRSRIFTELFKTSIKVLELQGISLVIASLPKILDEGKTVGKFLTRHGFELLESVYKRRLK